MAHWAVVVPAGRYAVERLYAHDTVDLPPGPVAGDEVLLVVDDGRPAVFGLGRVRDTGALGYTHRLLDEPLPVDVVPAGAAPGAHPLPPAQFAAVADRVPAHLRVDGPKRTWLVSVDLPIEASSPAEAVRIFWSYVRDLGPAELPAYVAPSDDELAMQAFVLGAEANQDPEEESD